MGDLIDTESLIARIQAQQREIESLKSQLAGQAAPSAASSRAAHESTTKRSWPLQADEYRRYGRQMILPNIGLQG
jgi:adenylyltransferase and sulfurtransferase